MSSAVITTLFAKNEFSASAVTTHSCFLLSDGQEIIRKMNLPDGWTQLRLYFKATLYWAGSGFPQSNISNARFNYGICSESRSLTNSASAHFVGIGEGGFGFGSGGSTTTWVPNANQGTSEGSGSFKGATNPEHSTWMYSAAAGGTQTFITNSSATGGGNSGHMMTLYNTVWSSSYTGSNGRRLDDIAGYAWSLYALELIKNAKTNATSITAPLGQETIRYSIVCPGQGSSGARYNAGINTPRAIVRRSMQYESGSNTRHDYDSWTQWYYDLTKDINVEAYLQPGSPETHVINEAFFGPLNCVNISWSSGDSNMKLAVRDVVVVKVA